MICAVAGCTNAADPIEVIGDANSSSGATTLSATALTTLSDDTLAFCAVCVDRDRVDSGDGLSTANGFSEFSTSGSSGGANGAGLIMAEKDIASTGGTLSPTFGTWASDQCVSRMFNMRSTAPSVSQTQRGYVF